MHRRLWFSTLMVAALASGAAAADDAGGAKGLANLLPKAPPLKTSDFFADDTELTEGIMRLADAVARADRPDTIEAANDLDRAVEFFEKQFQRSKSRGLGPLSEGGNPGREGTAALFLLKALALHRLGQTREVRSELAGLRRPPPRFVSKDLAGIPVVERGDPTRKVVALTFDDGPERPHTVEVLDVLKKHQVPATFFVVGRAARARPELLRRIHEEGHEVGQHSYTHPKLTQLDTAGIQEEIRRTDEVFSKVLPEVAPTTLFRLPYQVGSKSKIVQSVLAKRFDYLIDWSVDSKDYAAGSTQEILSNTLPGARQNGAILLFHDRRPHTAEAVDTLISTLKPEGWQFVTVSDAMGTDAAGRRLDVLVEGIEKVGAGKLREAARALGNFTLEHPTSKAAPAALFCSYFLARWIERPKADKLREALQRRYGKTLFGRLAKGDLPAASQFVAGGRLKLAAAARPAFRIPDLGPDPDAAALPELVLDMTAQAPVPSPSSTAVSPGALPSVAAPRPPPGAAPHGRAPPPLPAGRVAAVLQEVREPDEPPSNHPARLIQQLRAEARARVAQQRAARGETPLPAGPSPGSLAGAARAAFPPPDPPPALPEPYRDPAPSLDGSHMVDPERL